MEIYWSPVTILHRSPVPTVEPTRVTALWASLANRSVRLLSMPLPARTPPNVTEQMMRNIVLSIPVIPLVEIRESMASLPVCIAVEP